MELPLDQILLGNCLDLLKSIPDESIDSCVSDVPYGLGSKDPSPEDIFMYVLGGSLDTKGDFMGSDWEIPSIAVWKEVYRVLKPGGHVLSFGGTRTFDFISIGLRMAGFECRDTIAREYPILQWIQGQGMPKSHNVSVAIDKKLGKKREVLGMRRGRGGENLNVLSRPGRNDSEDAKGMGAYGVGAKQVDVDLPVTAPESEEAKQWEGWGSGLKPAFEPILVFRKPLAGTLAHNVLTYGTGGLNIDATRVRHASKEDFEKHKAQVDAVREKGGVRGKSWKNDSDLSGANEVKEGGRWPANALFCHAPGCQLSGLLRVKGSHAVVAQGLAPETGKPYPSASGSVYGDYGDRVTTSHVGVDGLEEVQQWECVDGCPVLALDAQSGDRPSTLTGRADPNGSHEHPGTEMNPNSTFLGERTHLSKVYADAGGASRFFTQIVATPEEAQQGRWPANIVFEHLAGCMNNGPHRFRGSGTSKSFHEAYDGESPTSFIRGVSHPGNQHGDADGLETADAWTCQEGCPVKALDEQSGVLKSGKDVNPTEGPVQGFFGQEMPYYSKDANYGDEGGASRFFTQLQEGERNPSEGRWPPNLVLQHAEGCVSKGFQRVKRQSGDIAGTEPSKSTGAVYGKYSKRAPNKVGEDGFETIEDWSCVDGCPVRILDEQSGDVRSAGQYPTTYSHGGGFNRGDLGHNIQGPLYSDGGGASRFFTQVQEGPEDMTEGRWPPNLVLQHAEGCVSKGLVKTKAPKGGAGILWSHIRDGKKGEAKPSTSKLGDEQGEETVEDWSCVDGCPVKEIREQGVESGSHAAGNKGETNHVTGNRVYGKFDPLKDNPDYHADAGGVDRFFTQFEAEGSAPFRYIPKANRREAGCGEFEVQHITVKPLDLMRWLVKLVTQKGGIVLDQYCGSGTTCHAAVLEGMHYIGIERDPVSHAEAVRRLEIVHARENERQEDAELFDIAMGGGD